MSSRMNQWFIPGDGIAREVITADIQRYLGPDALVRPGSGSGEYEGRPGYWITAYRTLTSQMIQDLRTDSQRWQAEKDRDHHGRVAYQDSRTHASRQHYGPSATSESYAAPSKPAYSSSSYSAGESPHYTTTPTATYPPYQAPPHSAHSAHPAHPAQPRTTEPAYYGQHQSYGQTPAPTYSYSQPATQDPYGRTQTTQYTTHTGHVNQTPSVVAAPGFYIASDGRQYPLSQQPQPPQPHAGRRR